MSHTWRVGGNEKTTGVGGFLVAQSTVNCGPDDEDSDSPWEDELEFGSDADWDPLGFDDDEEAEPEPGDFWPELDPDE